MGETALTDTKKAAAVWLPIAELVPWDRNPRKNATAVAKVAESIERFGFGAPLLARAEDKQIIAGHTRLLAAKKLGLTHVPVRLLDLDPADAKLLALADNRLGEIAEWDDEALARVLADLKACNADLSASGFDSAEIDRLLADLDSERMKPVPLIERAIRNSSQAGDTVLDVFGGSGSTLIAAARTGRKALLVELDPRYCDVIRQRWERFQAKVSGA